MRRGHGPLITLVYLRHLLAVELVLPLQYLSSKALHLSASTTVSIDVQVLVWCVFSLVLGTIRVRVDIL